MRELIERLITSAVLLAVVFFALFYAHSLPFALLIALFLAVATFEWCRLTGLQQALGQWLALLLNVALFFLLYWLWPLPLPWVYSAFLVLGWLWLFWRLVRQRLFQVPQVWLRYFGLSNLLFTAYFLLDLQQTHLSALLLLFALVWLADSAAYLFGRFFGRHPLTAISPQKTWEGVIAAFVANFLLALLLLWVLPWLRPQALPWLLFALLITAAALFGDLLESACKRRQGLKHSGQWLPGHGGVMDRLDSLLAATPFFVFFAAFFSWP